MDIAIALRFSILTTALSIPFYKRSFPTLLIVLYYCRYQTAKRKTKKKFQFLNLCSVFVRVFITALPIKLFAVEVVIGLVS